MTPLLAAIIFFAVFMFVFLLFGINPTTLRYRRSMLSFKGKRHLKNGMPRSPKCDTLVQAKCVRFVNDRGEPTTFERELRKTIYEVTYAGKTYEVNDRILRMHKNSEIGTVRDAYIDPNDEEEIYIDYGPEEHSKAQTIVFYALIAFIIICFIAAVTGINELISK